MPEPKADIRDPEPLLRRLGPLVRATCTLIALLSTPACSRCSSSTSSAANSATATATASVTPPVPAVSYTPPPFRSSWPVPTGPALAVLAGQGVGPIRFGATVATIERHMQAPCDVKTAEVCRYFARAIEFGLRDGVVASIHVHRMDRPAGKDATGKSRVYGAFNGGIPPDLRMGMLPWAIQQHLGKPKSIEKLGGGGEFDTVELHHYDGLVLEFDRLGTNQPILGGIRIVKGK